MTDKQLQKLTRRQLLEILVEQGRKIEQLEEQLERANIRLAEKQLKIKNAGSIAQAAMALTDIFEKAQQAADLYLENVKAVAVKPQVLPEENVTARQICEMIKDIDEQ